MTQETPTAPASRAADARPDEQYQHPTGSCILRLSALASSASMTRRHVRQLLRAWQLAAITDTAQLVASELVANAVTAAQAADCGIPLGGLQLTLPPIELSVRRTEVSVIIEVRDPNPEPPVLQQADSMDEGGRGLLIIEIVSSSWGYYAAEGGGKVVWCEIALATGEGARLLALTGSPVRPRAPAADRDLAV